MILITLWAGVISSNLVIGGEQGDLARWENNKSLYD